MFALLLWWQAAAGPARISLAVTESRICEQADGRRVAWFTVDTVYSNPVGRDVIVPRLVDFAVVSFTDTGGRRVSESRTLGAETYSNEFWETAEPGVLFVRVPAGERRIVRDARFHLTIRERRRSRALRDGTYRLIVTVDHGPHAARPLREPPWPAIGELVVGRIESEPAEIRIAVPEVVPACKGLPVIRRQRRWLRR